MQLHTIGIDLGKTVFHLVGLNPCGEVVVRKKFSRKQLLLETAKCALALQALGLKAGDRIALNMPSIVPQMPHCTSISADGSVKGKKLGRKRTLASSPK